MNKRTKGIRNQGDLVPESPMEVVSEDRDKRATVSLPDGSIAIMGAVWEQQTMGMLSRRLAHTHNMECVLPGAATQVGDAKGGGCVFCIGGALIAVS